ncbi:YueH family protein [Jeotgalibacillus soli]|uniref:YueH-like protein n=1 Tax=Jeotgalibacillus soli TaxID=889306 RepID=A0A0C2VA52_9BACL|nr:YueH family protein [Jeotgalibacillus soli]KIL45847.1 hypothetical protein KP78_21960 [Jeotgalibacillus soli]
MKIRNSISSHAQRKVFIHENKKEETVLVAIPSLSWSILFSYEEYGDRLITALKESLKHPAGEESEELAHRIAQWTGEM